MKIDDMLPWVIGIALAGIGLGARTASAVDGVNEINQTCAEHTGCSATDAPGFPVSLTESGSYRLVGNLALADLDTTAIVVTAHDVTIDLNGFSIRPREECRPDCGAPGNGSGIVGAQMENLTIRNGSLVGLGHEGIRTGDYAQISDVRIFGVGATGIVTKNHSEIRDTTVAGTGLNGIDAGHGVAILDSIVRSAGGEGIRADGTPLVSRTRLQNNGQGGLHIDGRGGVLVASVISGNGGEAVEARDALVADNMLSENALGMFFLNGNATLVRGNAVSLSNSVDVGSTVGALVVDNAISGQITAGLDAGTSGNVITDGGSATDGSGTVIEANVCDGVLGCP